MKFCLGQLKCVNVRMGMTYALRGRRGGEGRERKRAPASGERAGEARASLRGPEAAQGAAWNQMPRSSSLMPVLARVLASTCLTMTAQYRLYLPSLEGSEPDTTTEPAGTRP